MTLLPSLKSRGYLLISKEIREQFGVHILDLIEHKMLTIVSTTINT